MTQPKTIEFIEFFATLRKGFQVCRNQNVRIKCAEADIQINLKRPGRKLKLDCTVQTAEIGIHHTKFAQFKLGLSKLGDDFLERQPHLLDQTSNVLALAEVDVADCSPNVLLESDRTDLIAISAFEELVSETVIHLGNPVKLDQALWFEAGLLSHLAIIDRWHVLFWSAVRVGKNIEFIRESYLDRFNGDIRAKSIRSISTNDLEISAEIVREAEGQD